MLIVSALAVFATAIATPSLPAFAERSTYRQQRATGLHSGRRNSRLGRMSAAAVFRRGRKASQHREVVMFRHTGVQEGWGTGVIVGRSRNGREGLVLTVNHNLTNPGSLAGAHVKVGDQRARVTEVVASNTSMDYALVRVALPKQGMLRRIGGFLGRVLRGGKVGSGALPAPTKVAAEVGVGESVYLNGYPMPSATNPRGRVRFGQEVGGEVTPVDTGSSTRAVPSLLLNYSSGEGFSGAPVYSARSHKMIGVHHGNNFIDGGEISFAVPAGMIMQDLAGKLGRGEIARRSRGAIKRLLKTSGVDLNSVAP